MRPQHVLLALATVFFWGINFAVIKIGLEDVSPLWMLVARFVLAGFPWVFIVPRPKAPIRAIVLFSMLTFALQFCFLFVGMQIGMSAGLASLILQLQVFFTIGLSVVLLNEKPSLPQVSGAVLAFAGIALVAANIGGETTTVGLGLMILAALSWSAGNIVSRKISDRSGSQNILGVVVWGSAFAVVPLIIVAPILDPKGLHLSFDNLDWVSLGAIAYIAYLSTLFCYAAWGWLLANYPVATVTPFALLVPVFGFLGSAVLLGEPLQPWKLGAAALVIAGLLLNMFGGKLSLRR